MADPVTREEFATPAGRRRAWRELMFADHGALRLFYRNVHEIAPGRMWRSYQPSPGQLRRWRERGVKTVVNLRGDKPSGFYFLEEDACRRLGLRLVTFRVFSREAPSREILHGARRLFDEIEYPALMHCKSGADRVGLMATLFLFLHEGVPLDAAMRQLSWRYGHIRHGKTGVIDRAFEDYIDYARRAGKSLSSVDDFFEWVDGVYDPARVKAAFMGSWWGNLLTERVLRRE
ncbi:fused DSP-PTPase phosphatase/NAD kinase-like protein [Amphiplicatus metriothermophilus]|uniref:Protein tyrosine/serine phosphatase n=1 Tax=Amphiplicatus metriothermophilus TaxID=1519374 RepID=A0A239PSA8_9PROT|nr:tyrosine-protein phosphatase [Amphiplicatus metriothermophilus]MBB5519109.1 protein tyrosine/serine phosphatase [Amphiplicatus metriothermophilus]SNT73179.1 Protein tyrosine/serine phosphatase [Amphiplicatus metriothermophilus]